MSEPAPGARAGLPPEVSGPEWLVLPAFVEPHAHLDKAYTADAVPNPAGDLAGAISGWLAYRPGIRPAAARARAERAVRSLVARGTTRVRSHLDTGADVDPAVVGEIVALREALAPVVELQLVALASRPITGAAGAQNRARLRAAIAAGVDLVGGAPWLEDEPRRALETLAGIASEAGLDLDLHVDETVDPRVLTLPDLADLAEAGFPGRITASHAVSLGSQDEGVQRGVAERLAAARVGVVALPGTNLFLQERGVRVGPARGLTAVRSLLDAGVVLAGGADNLRDPFNAVGTTDPLATAGLLVAAGHLTVAEALAAVSTAAREVTDLSTRPGAAGADVVALRVGSVGDALADQPGERVTVRNGVVVARTRFTVHWAHPELEEAAS